MSVIYILGIAVALAMDAFAVSVAVGISLKKIHFRQAFRLSFHFGLFQALMPVAGWLMGSAIHKFSQEYAHWISFSLLALVGTNMIREAFMGEDEKSDKDPTRGLNLVILSIATSIDALAVGISLSLINAQIILPAIIIGIVAACFTLIGMNLGRHIGKIEKLCFYAEIGGGLVLWLIGLHILYERGVFSFLGI